MQLVETKYDCFDEASNQNDKNETMVIIATAVGIDIASFDHLISDSGECFNNGIQVNNCEVDEEGKVVTAMMK